MHMHLYTSTYYMLNSMQILEKHIRTKSFQRSQHCCENFTQRVCIFVQCITSNMEIYHVEWDENYCVHLCMCMQYSSGSLFIAALNNYCSLYWQNFRSIFDIYSGFPLLQYFFHTFWRTQTHIQAKKQFAHIKNEIVLMVNKQCELNERQKN